MTENKSRMNISISVKKQICDLVDEGVPRRQNSLDKIQIKDCIKYFDDLQTKGALD